MSDIPPNSNEQPSEGPLAEGASDPEREGTSDTANEGLTPSDGVKECESSSDANKTNEEENSPEGAVEDGGAPNKQGGEKQEIIQSFELPPNATARDLRNIMTNEIARIKAMTPAEFVASMASMEKLHNDVYIVAERLIREILSRIPEISPTLKKVGEYDQFVFDRIMKTTAENFRNIGKSAEDREELILTIQDRMSEAVKVNFDFTHQISYVASPLTVWRLDACKAVWAGHNEIVNALESEKVLLEDPNAPKDGEAENADGDEDNEGGGKHDENMADADAEKDAENAENAIEEHVEGELDLEEIAKSERPPLKAWPKRVYTSGEGEKTQIVCYVRAPPDCLVNDEDIICTFGNSFASWPNLPGNSEVIGKFVCIRPRHPKVVCILPSEPWIVGIPHSFGKTSTKEVVIFWMEAGEMGPVKLIEDVEGEPVIPTADATVGMTETEALAKVQTETPEPVKIPWIDLQTADVTGDDSRYLEIRLTKLTEVVLAPAARIRRDTAELGRNGGKLSSLVDNRVALTIQPGALRISLMYCMQVQSINQHHAQLLRDQNLTFMSAFVACSPLVILSGPKKILFKPATITLPLTDLNPTTQVVIMSSSAMPDNFSSNKTGNESEDATNSDDDVKVKKSGAISLDPFQRSLLLPKLLAGATSSQAEVSLLIAGLEDSNWVLWNSPEIIETKNSDVCIFNCVRIQSCKIMAIKTRTVVDPESLLQMAMVLERSLAQRMVFFILRQDRSDPKKICLAVSLNSNLDKTMQVLENEGFTEGDKPTGPLFIHERQVFDITFKGNIRPKKGGTRDSVHLTPGFGPMRIAFNSSLRNRYIVEVEECDPSAQVACEKFRGFLEISFQHMVQKPVKKTKARASIRGPNKKFVMELETVMLCQLLIKLPKHGSEQPTLAEMQAFNFIPKDMVTEAYLVTLSKKLVGDNWRRLGGALGLTKTQLQAIGGRAESAGANKALTMLNTWVKNLPLEIDRCLVLLTALLSIGRNDLAGDLRQDNTQLPGGENPEGSLTPPMVVKEPTLTEAV